MFSCEYCERFRDHLFWRTSPVAASVTSSVSDWTRARTFFSHKLKLGVSWNYMPPILVPSSAKCIVTQILVTANLNRRKYLVLKGVLMIWSFPAKNCLFRVSKLKHKNTVWKLLKVKNEDIRTASMASLWCLLWIYFTLCSNCLLWTGKQLLGSYWKDKHSWRQERVYHALCRSILNVNKVY